MDQETVQTHAQAVCDALVAGEIERATEDFSQELKSHLGEVITLLPLPITEATVESVEQGAKGFVVVLNLIGETDKVRLQTRWKEREDRPTVVEASHIVEQAVPSADVPADLEEQEEVSS